MNKTVIGLLIAAIVVMSFTAESLMTVKPALPKEIEVKVCKGADEARAYILSQHYKGWITQATGESAILVTCTKY